MGVSISDGRKRTREDSEAGPARSPKTSVTCPPLPLSVVEMIYRYIPTGRDLAQTDYLLETRRVSRLWHNSFNQTFSALDKNGKTVGKRTLILNKKALETFLQIFRNRKLNIRDLHFRLQIAQEEEQKANFWNTIALLVEGALSMGSTYAFYQKENHLGFFESCKLEKHLYHILDNTPLPKITETALLHKLPKHEGDTLNIRFSRQEARRHLLARCTSSSFLPETAFDVPAVQSKSEFELFLFVNKIDFLSPLSVHFHPIHLAAAFGLTNVVSEYIISKEVSSNIIDSSGYNLLHYAVFYNSRNKELIDLLIDNGVNINQLGCTNHDQISHDHNCCTPLHLAAALGEISCFQHLLGKGADDSPIQGSYSLLYHACRLKQWDMMHYLVNNGVVSNISTDLIFLLDSPNYDSSYTTVSKFLIENGANVNSTLEFGESILSPPVCSLMAENLDEVLFLMDNGATSVGGFWMDDINPLTRALQIDPEGKIFPHLLDKVVDIDMDWCGGDTKVVEDDYTPFHHLLLSDHSTQEKLKSARLLIERGICVNSSYDQNYATLFRDAIEKGEPEIVQLLIEHGADLEKGKPSKTPLLIALENNLIEIAGLLIRSGAEVTDEALAQIHQTPDWGAELPVQQPPKGDLISLIQYKKMDTLRESLEFGASINEENEEGFTPLTWTIRNGNLEAVELLLEYGADLNLIDGQGFTPLTRAIQGGGVKMVDLLLEKGAALEKQDGFGNTPLLLATKRGRRNYVQLFLEKGADHTVRDLDGLTPFDICLYENYGGLLDLFLKKKPKVNITYDKCGSTPLIWAAKHRYTDAVKYFLENQVSIEDRDLGGKTALAWAEERGHKGIVRLLREAGLHV